MFDQFKWYKTFMDSVNPITKLFIAIALFPIVVFIHNPNQMFYLALSMLILLFVLSGIKYHYVLIIVVIGLFFSILSAMYMILYGEGHTTIFKWGLIHVTEESLIRGGHIMLRGLTMSFFGSLIIFTTKITDVFYSLMQQLRLKPKFAYSFMAGIRMVPIIFEEYMTLRRTRKVRASLVPRRYTRGFTGFLNMIVTLLSQSIRRAYRLGVAMESKGFTDDKRTYYYETKLTFWDAICLVMIIGVILLSLYLGLEIPLIDTVDAR